MTNDWTIEMEIIEWSWILLGFFFHWMIVWEYHSICSHSHERFHLNLDCPFANINLASATVFFTFFLYKSLSQRYLFRFQVLFHFERFSWVCVINDKPKPSIKPIPFLIALNEWYRGIDIRVIPFSAFRLPYHLQSTTHIFFLQMIWFVTLPHSKVFVSPPDWSNRRVSTPFILGVDIVA
jgi:hypothetical protein